MSGAESDPCLNCGLGLGIPRPRFCGSCGQETHRRPPTLMEFAQQFGGAYFSTEGALWRTLVLLVAQPGALTVAYLAGRRKHYVLPLRLYLSVSLVVLLAMRLVAMQSLDSQRLRVDDPERAEFALLSFGSERWVGFRQGRFQCVGLPPALCQRIERRTGGDVRLLARDAQQVGERYFSNLGLAMFVLMPMFALLLRLLWAGSDRRYTEHLVFALHLHAFWFLVLALLLVPWPPVSAAAACAMLGYGVLAWRRVYPGPWAAQLWRGVLLGLAYAVLLAVAVVGVSLWTVAT